VSSDRQLREPERLAREAIALAEQTDMLNARGDALLDLAEVLALAGRDARAELEQALVLYEQKRNFVMAERTRSRLAQRPLGRGSLGGAIHYEPGTGGSHARACGNPPSSLLRLAATQAVPTGARRS